MRKTLRDDSRQIEDMKRRHTRHRQMDLSERIVRACMLQCATFIQDKEGRGRNGLMLIGPAEFEATSL